MKKSNSLETVFLMSLVNGMWQDVYHTWFIFEILLSPLCFSPLKNLKVGQISCQRYVFLFEKAAEERIKLHL